MTITKEKVFVYIKFMAGVVIVYAIGRLTGWLDTISILPMSLGLLGIILCDIVVWLYKKIKLKFCGAKTTAKE